MNYSDQKNLAPQEPTQDDSSKAHSQFQSMNYPVPGPGVEAFNFEDYKMGEAQPPDLVKRQRKKSSGTWKLLQNTELRKSSRLNTREKEEALLKAQEKEEEENKMTEQEQEQLQENLRQYNKARNQFDNLMVMPTRVGMIRRLSMKLQEDIPFLYKHQVKQIVEEASMSMLLNELELVHWYQAMKLKFLSRKDDVPNLTKEEVLKIVYEAARQVKTDHKSHWTTPIDAHLRYYENMALSKNSSATEFDSNTQSFQAIQPMSLKEQNRLFKELNKPLQNERFSSIIEYNWVVDSILKNSMPYETQRSNRQQLTTHRKRKRTDKLKPSEVDKQKKGKKRARVKYTKAKKRRGSDELSDEEEPSVGSQKSDQFSDKEASNMKIQLPQMIQKPMVEGDDSDMEEEKKQEVFDPLLFMDDERSSQMQPLVGPVKQHSITNESQSSSRKTTGRTNIQNVEHEDCTFQPTNRHYEQGPYTNISPTMPQYANPAFMDQPNSMMGLSQTNSMLSQSLNNPRGFHMGDLNVLNLTLHQLQQDQAQNQNFDHMLSLSRSHSVSQFLYPTNSNPNAVNSLNDDFNFHSQR